MFKKQGKRKYVPKNYKGKSKNRLNKAYKDSHNFKFMAPSTGIANTGAGATATPSAFGSHTALGTVTNVGGTCTFAGALIFSTVSVPQMTVLAAYWDRFRVNKIKVRIIPEINYSSPVGQGQLPVMKVIHDYDDNSTTGSNAAQIWARRGKEFRLDKEHSFSFVPRVNYNTSNIGGNIPMLIQKAPMINCTASTNVNNFVQLYGIKFAVKDWYCNGGAPVNNNVCRIEVCYYVTYKEQLNLGLGLNIADFNIPTTVATEQFVDPTTGYIYDNPGFTGDPLFVPDADGNEVPYVPPPA